MAGPFAKSQFIDYTSGMKLVYATLAVSFLMLGAGQVHAMDSGSDSESLNVLASFESQSSDSASACAPVIEKQ
jgi:hypothetical protein